jgi:hypothetical protein
MRGSRQFLYVNFRMARYTGVVRENVLAAFSESPVRSTGLSRALDLQWRTL